MPIGAHVRLEGARSGLRVAKASTVRDLPELLRLPEPLLDRWGREPGLRSTVPVRQPGRMPDGVELEIGRLRYAYAQGTPSGAPGPVSPRQDAHAAARPAPALRRSTFDLRPRSHPLTR